uniref:Dolichol phosphate-mannose biosynthesis regulatory protein n=1 Tax=Panagrellus redivivus TaxID=6233 RepID=A0A7E4W690_PANRE
MIRHGIAGLFSVSGIYLLLWLYATPFMMDGNPLLLAFPLSRLVAIYLILGVFFCFAIPIAIYGSLNLFAKTDVEIPSNNVKLHSRISHSKLKRN